MFIITPKPKNNGLQAQASQPVAKIRTPARVQAACDRCRMKKVKCDGCTPCLRCSQDEVICVASRKAPTDPKAASLEYIRSMEAQQSQLIKALTAVTRHVRQPVGEKELKEILDTVRKFGFDFEEVGDRLNITRPIPEIAQGRGPQDTEGGIESHARKRKRGKEALDDYSCRVPASVADPAKCSQLSILDTAMPLQEDHSTIYQPVSEPVDDYWALDAYWDHVASPFQSIPATDLCETSHVQGNVPLPSENQALPFNQSLDDTLLSSCNSEDYRQSIDSQFITTGPATGSDADFPSLSAFSQPEWDSTLWWDPSLIFDTAADTSPS